MKQVIVCYVPVIHDGYIQFFSQYPSAKILLLSRKFLEGIIGIEKAEKLKRDLRAVKTELIAEMILSGLDRPVSVLISSEMLDSYDEIIMPEDDLCKAIAEKIPNKKIVWDSIFLRWDWGAATAQKIVEPEGEITEDELHQKMMQHAVIAAKQSSDWWRQVGAALITSAGDMIVAHNEHMPHVEIVYINGDPRSNLNAGMFPEVCTAIHAEAALLATAAAGKGGTQDGILYVTTYPCPACARLIVHAGIKELYFKEGYSNLDAKEILALRNIRVIKIK